MSIPYRFKVVKSNDKFVVADSIYPKGYSYYIEDMKNMFSKSVKDDMDRIIDMLKTEVEEHAKLYFHK